MRGAINASNTNAGVDIIEFEIPGPDVKTITPTSALPAITQAVTINGHSQPGASANTRTVGTNAALKIELSGANAGGGVDGITITGPNSVILRA